MVNPGPFRLCARCGASMETFLQESAGFRRTAAIQSLAPGAVPHLIYTPGPNYHGDDRIEIAVSDENQFSTARAWAAISSSGSGWTP